MRSLGLRGSFTQNQEIFPPHDDSSWRRSFGQKLEATSNGVLPVTEIFYFSLNIEGFIPKLTRDENPSPPKHHCMTM